MREMLMVCYKGQAHPNHAQVLILEDLPVMRLGFARPVANSGRHNSSAEPRKGGPAKQGDPSGSVLSRT